MYVAEVLDSFWTKTFHGHEIFVELNATAATIRIKIVCGVEPNYVKHFVPNNSVYSSVSFSHTHFKGALCHGLRLFFCLRED